MAHLKLRINSFKILGVVLVVLLVLELNSLTNQRQSDSLVEATLPFPKARIENYFAILKRASRQGADYARNWAVSIPFKKILLAGGALLSLFFIFVRLLIVLGPILLLGAMTRESTDATDLLRMLIEFYNQVIVALDEQMLQQQPASMAA